MATLTQVKDALVTKLNGSSDLTTFGLKKVYEGLRVDIPVGSLPCICIEPESNDEGRLDVNTIVGLVTKFALYAIIYEKDLDDQIDSLFDFEKAVKKAISADVTLSSNAINCEFTKTEYGIFDWPARVAKINVDVVWRQNYTTRT